MSGATAMPQFDPELIEVMKKVLEDIMTRVPSEHSTPAAKAYFAECILKAAAQGKTNYDALIIAAADQIEVFVSFAPIAVATAQERRIGPKIRRDQSCHVEPLSRWLHPLVSALF